MLSYRHGYHAGNHADVLKHWVLCLCLEYLAQKPKPLLYIDTHAGAGRYRLSHKYAEQTGEYLGGIGRVWQRPDVPSVLAGYLNVVQQANSAGLQFYPGSCGFAAALLRADDKLALAELHSTEYELLSDRFARDTRVRIEHTDGFALTKALLPPATRRGLVLVDPPYELKEDYQKVITTLQDSLKRFATGSYLIWFPLLNSEYSQTFVRRLQAATKGSWLAATLTVKHPPTGAGMYGSGLFVINPPYTLANQLSLALPWLAETLAVDDGAGYDLKLEA